MTSITRALLWLLDDNERSTMEATATSQACSTLPTERRSDDVPGAPSADDPVHLYCDPREIYLA